MESLFNHIIMHLALNISKEMDDNMTITPQDNKCTIDYEVKGVPYSIDIIMLDQSVVVHKWDAHTSGEGESTRYYSIEDYSGAITD